MCVLFVDGSQKLYAGCRLQQGYPHFLSKLARGTVVDLSNFQRLLYPTFASKVTYLLRGLIGHGAFAYIGPTFNLLLLSILLCLLLFNELNINIGINELKQPSVNFYKTLRSIINQTNKTLFQSNLS
jgi:hypothetical protein